MKAMLPVGFPCTGKLLGVRLTHYARLRGSTHRACSTTAHSALPCIRSNHSLCVSNTRGSRAIQARIPAAPCGGRIRPQSPGISRDRSRAATLCMWPSSDATSLTLNEQPGMARFSWPSNGYTVTSTHSPNRNHHTLLPACRSCSAGASSARGGHRCRPLENLPSPNAYKVGPSHRAASEDDDAVFDVDVAAGRKVTLLKERKLYNA